MTVHVPSPIPSPGPKRPDNWLFDLMTAGASFDFSLLAPQTTGLTGPSPEPDGFVIAFALSPKLFQE